MADARSALDGGREALVNGNCNNAAGANDSWIDPPRWTDEARLDVVNIMTYDMAGRLEPDVLTSAAFPNGESTGGSCARSGTVVMRRACRRIDCCWKPFSGQNLCLGSDGGAGTVYINKASR